MERRRVFVGGMHHESDTFNPIVTSREDIWVVRGRQLLESKGKESVNGIVDTLVSAGYDVVPGLVARAVPNGEWDQDCFMELAGEFLGSLKASLPLDALCLSLHGSMRVKGLGEAEGYLLEEIRRICPDIPIISSLDMHATISERMMRNADCFVGYKCAPHTDTYETGVLAAEITRHVLEDGVRLHMAAVHLPFIIAGEQSETGVEPMKGLTDLLRDMEKRPHIVGASYLLGFPWADVAENGVTAIAVSDDCQETADGAALELAHEFWDSRREFGFYNETREVMDAIDHACRSIEDGVFPVVLSDSGDNPTAGSSQDVTNFLKTIISDRRLVGLDPPLCYQAIYDPVFCSKAIEAGAGNNVTCDLGASFDRVTSTPVHVDGLVKAVCLGWEGAQDTDMVLVDVNGVDVVVTSRHVGCYDPEMMKALGVSPDELKAIVVKLGYLEPEIRAVARRSIMVLTDGSSNEIFTRLPYRNLQRPIYPLDPDTECSFSFIGHP